MKENCVFCDMVNDPNQVIWKNSYFYASFDRFPVTPGHAEIVPLKHIENLISLNFEEWQSLQISIREVISIIENTDLKVLYKSFIDSPLSEISTRYCRQVLDDLELFTKPDAYNHGVNDGKAAGRTIDHLHWHIIPRYFGDVKDPRGGVRYVIPEKGNYKK